MGYLDFVKCGTFVYALLAATIIITVDGKAGKNILVFAPMPFKSHFRGFQPLFIELAGKGYNLTVVSTFPLKTPIENYTDIPITVDDSILKGPFMPIRQMSTTICTNPNACERGSSF